MKKEIRKNNYGLCMPLTGENMQVLENEINEGLGKNYGFFEWRRDYFKDALKTEGDYLKEICSLVREKALIYTFRNAREGGVSHVSDQVRLEKIKAAIKSGLIDYIDIELDNDPYFLAEIDKMLAGSAVKKILSYHNFKKTPADELLINRLDQMCLNQADVFKIAIHTGSLADLRRLIGLSLDYGKKTPKPLIVIAMGPLGRITRIAPEFCGGSLSFAAGKKQTAPGQLSYEEILGQRKALGLS